VGVGGGVIVLVEDAVADSMTELLSEVVVVTLRLCDTDRFTVTVCEGDGRVFVRLGVGGSVVVLVGVAVGSCVGVGVGGGVFVAVGEWVAKRVRVSDGSSDDDGLSEKVAIVGFAVCVVEIVLVALCVNEEDITPLLVASDIDCVRVAGIVGTVGEADAPREAV
jgi:hypothetical protein